MKRFSIVVCTYNGEKYLEKVLNSILNMDQLDTYVDNIIVVDNASTDKTKSICQKYAKRIANFKYEFEPKPGLANARKHAAYVESEWVIYFDDDNIPSRSWLKNADINIKKNNDLGAFGGRNIALPDSACSQENLLVLNAFLSNLACHYMSYNDYRKQQNIMSPESVFGAGMTIKTEILKKYLGDGWSFSVGRNKSSLSSYEDTEMLNYVSSLGYRVQSFENLYLFHIIPKFRTEIEYIKKLRKGMSDSEINYILHQHNSKKISLLKLVRNSYRVIKYSILFLLYRNNEVANLRCRFYVKSALYEIKLYLGAVVS